MHARIQLNEKDYLRHRKCSKDISTFEEKSIPIQLKMLQQSKRPVSEQFTRHAK